MNEIQILSEMRLVVWQLSLSRNVTRRLINYHGKGFLLPTQKAKKQTNKQKAKNKFLRPRREEVWGSGGSECGEKEERLSQEALVANALLCN